MIKIKSFDQLVCLSGLPRTGSTLLSSLLSQNPTIHSEGQSGLCELMWQTEKTCESINHIFASNNRLHTSKDIISQLPHSYYKNNSPQEKIVVDKSRSWTNSDCSSLLDDFVGDDIKIIVMVRPLVEICKSLVRIFKSNGVYTEQREKDLFDEIIIQPLTGVQVARESNSNRFIFVSYQDLVENTSQTLKRIYSFCGWPPFIHNTNNVDTKYVERDDFYRLKDMQVNGIKGMHDIRKKIEYRSNDTVLMDRTIRMCEGLETGSSLTNLILENF